MAHRRLLTPSEAVTILASVLLEFVADVEMAGLDYVEGDWPDLFDTYRKAKNALGQEISIE